MIALLTRLSNHHLTVVTVVAFALFMDYLIYGIVGSVSQNSPARISDETHLGMLYGGYAAGILLATPLFGYLGDKLGCRKPMIGGVILSMLATLGFWLAQDFPVMLMARLCQGAAAAASWTAGLALVAEHYPEKRVQMMGIAMMGSTAGSVFGPTLGGELFEAGGYGLPFMVAAALVAIDACLRIFLLPKERPAQKAGAAWQVLLFDRSVLVASLAVVLAAVGWGIIEPLVPIHMKSIYSDPRLLARILGLMFTVSTIAYGVVAPLVGFVTDKLTIKRTIMLGLVLMAVSLPSLALAENAIAAGALLCLVSVSYAFLLNPSSAELGNAVDRRGLDCYAAVYAVYNIAYALGMLGSDIFASICAPKLGFTWSLVAVSGMILGCIPLLHWAYSSQAKDEADTPVETPETAPRLATETVLGSDSNHDSDSNYQG